MQQTTNHFVSWIYWNGRCELMKDLLHKSMNILLSLIYEPSRHVYSMFVDTVKLCIFQLVTAKKKYEYFLGF